MTEKSDLKIVANEDSTCTIIPSFAFTKIFLIDYKRKLYKLFFNKVSFNSIYLKDSLKKIILKTLLNLLVLVFKNIKNDLLIVKMIIIW